MAVTSPGHAFVTTTTATTTTTTSSSSSSTTTGLFSTQPLPDEVRVMGNDDARQQQRYQYAIPQRGGSMQRYNPNTGWIGNQNMPEYGLSVSPTQQYSPARHGGQHYSSYRDDSTAIVDGNTRQTWQSNPYSRTSGAAGVPQLITFETDGRPMHGEFELWEGPNNVPQKVRVYSEDGFRRPFQTLVQPRPGTLHSMSVRNNGPLEFPMRANIQPSLSAPSTRSVRNNNNYHNNSPMVTVQGQSLKTFQVGHGVQQVLLEMETEGGQIQATVELWEGPGAAKQVAEIYNDDGYARPFSALIDTSGWFGSTIAVRNTSFMEFPIRVRVTPYF